MMYPMWFSMTNGEPPIEAKPYGLGVARRLWDDLAAAGWHMISARP